VRCRAAQRQPKGQVVGYSLPAGNFDFHAFLWAKGSMTDLGTLEGDESGAHAINPAGVVVGSGSTREGEIHATSWTVK